MTAKVQAVAKRRTSHEPKERENYYSTICIQFGSCEIQPSGSGLRV